MHKKHFRRSRSSRDEGDMNKPTPGPWKWNTAAGIYGINGKRCVNVFVQDEINLPLEEMDANAALIVSAVNACFAVSPDNPLAVAEGLPELAKACRTFLVKKDEMPRSTEHAIRNALAKLEAK